MEPSETELEEISGELLNEKGTWQRRAQPLLDSRDPHTMEQAFKVMREIKKASQRGQKGTCNHLRRLGMIQESSETSSVGTGDPGETTRPPHTSNTRCRGDLSSGRARLGAPGGCRRGQEPGLMGGFGPLLEAVDLMMRCFDV
jgi:hypothetical protein